MPDVPRLEPARPDVSRLSPAMRASGTKRPPQRHSGTARPDIAASFAARQYGVVTRAQLLAAGMSTSAIHRRVSRGSLIPVHLGVYAVGHTALRPEGSWLAAVFAGGTGAALSHRSAAAAWDLLSTSRTRVEITVRESSGRKQRGIQTHECRLPDDHTTTHRGIPITTPMRTLLDLAEVVPPKQLERAMERTITLRLFDATALSHVLDASFGRRGLKPVRAALATLDDDPPVLRSDFEQLARELIETADVPKPRFNARVGPYEVDLLWPDHRLIIELDSYAHHRSRESFEQDRRRDAELEAAGYRVLRFTWDQVTSDPGWVTNRIAVLLHSSGG
jgi:very-short-patch-repair endonuclease